jgi:predicted dehydrogenase
MKKLRLGIIGGGPGSWIGHVHRIASRFDDKYEIVAGVFSRNFKVNQSFGVSIGINKNRCYKDFKQLCDKEKKRKDGIEVIAIMTPPGSHQIIAELFIKNNIHVISDKPFAGTLPQAKKLYKTIIRNKKIVYGLTHNYSAYPMVRHAKKLIEDKKLGNIEYINIEYVQDWSNGVKVTAKNAKKVFRWKLDKKIAGVSTVLNEIGSHAYHLCNYITGLKGKSLFADIKKYSKKIKFDTNAQVFINYENGAKGLFWASTTAKGGIYGLRIRVFGSKGSLEWVQNDPNYLKYSSENGATKILERGFNESNFSKSFSRIKYGHPEGYLSAFSNLYKEIALKINLKKSKKRFYFPTAFEGLLTAKFIDGCVKSSSKKKWVQF